MEVAVIPLTGIMFVAFQDYPGLGECGVLMKCKSNLFKSNCSIQLCISPFTVKFIDISVYIPVRTEEFNGRVTNLTITLFGNQWCWTDLIPMNEFDEYLLEFS